MLRIFQNIRPVSAIYVFIVGLLLRAPVLLFNYPLTAQFDSGFLQSFFDLVNQNVIVSIVLGFLLVYIESILFNRLCIDFDVLYHHSYLPAYFFMILNSIYRSNFLFNPILIVNLFILISFTFSYRLYQADKSSTILFYTSLFFGLAALFIPEFYFSAIFILIGTMVYKNINVKDILSIITGLLFPIFCALGIYYLLGKPYKLPNINYRVILDISFSGQNYLAATMVALLTVAGVLKSTINYSKNNIRTRRIAIYMIIYLLFALSILAFKSAEARLFFPLLAFTCAIQLSYFLIGSKGRRWKEFLHYIFLVGVIVTLYGKFIF